MARALASCPPALRRCGRPARALLRDEVAERKRRDQRKRDAERCGRGADGCR